MLLPVDDEQIAWLSRFALRWMGTASLRQISRGTLGTLMFFPDYEGMVIWSLVALGNFVIAQGGRCAVPTQR